MSLFYIDTSLLSVKKALSYIRWHHDRLDHLKVSSGAEPEEHLHLTVCHMVIDIVCQVFTPGEQNEFPISPK